MQSKNIDQILSDLKNDTLSIDQAKKALQDLQAQPLGFATIDHQRLARSPLAEVILATHKTSQQIIDIASAILDQNHAVLITRQTDQQFKDVQNHFTHKNITITTKPQSKTTLLGSPPKPRTSKGIAIVTAGTSDLHIAQEAQLTAQAMATPTTLINDVGVAGLHRLLNRLPEIQKTSAVVCIAGMEGALPSVLAGLIQIPIIAVPSSVGYGSNQQGITTLLAMLSSCAAGVTTVNIDNGFGAAYAAAIIDQNSSNTINQPI